MSASIVCADVCDHLTRHLRRMLGLLTLLCPIACGPGTTDPLPEIHYFVFVTQQTWPASTFNAQKADDLCHHAATQQDTLRIGPTLGDATQWVAWLSSYDAKVTVDMFYARNRLQTGLLQNHPSYATSLNHFLWYGTDNPTQASDPLFRGYDIVAPGPRAGSGGIIADENGRPISTAGTTCEPIWTGTNLHGDIQEQTSILSPNLTCRDGNLVSWNSTTGNGSPGCAAQTGTSWTDSSGALPCSTPGHLICFQVK